MGKKNKAKVQRKRASKEFNWESLQKLRTNYNSAFGTVYRLINFTLKSAIEAGNITETGADIVQGFNNAINDLYDKFCKVGTVHVDYQLNEQNQVEKEIYRKGMVSEKDMEIYVECYKVYVDIYNTLLNVSQKSLLELVEVIDPTLELKDDILKIVETIVEQKETGEELTEVINSLVETLKKQKELTNATK